MLTATKELFTRPSSYQISRSVRLRSSATAYFSKTFAGANNRKTWTWSGWVKRGSLSSAMTLFDGYAGATSYTSLFFDSNNSLGVVHYGGTLQFNWITTAVFRDPSAWYHIVLAFDTTQASSTNRIALYVNGVKITSYAVQTTGAQNTDTFVGAANAHNIGRSGSATQYFDGYLAEINCVNGQALTPSSFGETNTVTGVWQPKQYTGTYGVNSFEINFSDNSGLTNLTIGRDYSGNGNGFTPSNVSITAGMTYDSMLDVPTPFADRGNYCVLNPLDRNTNLAPSNANMTYAVSGAVQYSTRSTIFPTSGKWYAEFTISSSSAIIAIANQNAAVQGLNGLNGVFAITTQIFNNSGTAAQTGLASFAASDVIAIAYDADTNSVQFYRNNSTYGTAVTPSATGPFCFFVGANGATCTVNANFGQRPFSYTPPTGFLALNTQNLPDATIKNGAAYMAANLFTGNSATQTVNNAINNVSFQPDLIWFKNRSNALDHAILDAVRGGTPPLFLSSNTTTAEGSTGGGESITYNSNGFAIVSNNQRINFTGYTYVAWQWKAGGTAVSNTAGSITSSVSANTTAGFSVVTWTGNGSNINVGHGLGVAPNMIIIKSRSAVSDWYVYHSSIGTGKYILLDTTAATVTNANYFTASTSTVFSATSAATGINTSAATYVAYCFAAVAGYSAFGSYTGNGSTDGPFVFLGFRPKFIMIKATSTTSDWNMFDDVRPDYNGNTAGLQANLSNAESSPYTTDFLSNGFKLRIANYVNVNAVSYIYAAFAENPFKNSLAR